MSTTRTSLRTELKDSRVGSTAFTDAQLNYFIDTAIQGLYPVYYKLYVDTTTAAGTVIETAPSGCVNIHEILVQGPRPRRLRGWREGQGEAFVPAYAIGDGTPAGGTLIWHWTTGWDAPASDGAAIDIPNEAREYVLLKAHMMCLQNLLTSRLETDKFFAIQVRQAITEDELLAAIDSIQRQLDTKAQQAKPLPKVEQ